MTDSIEHVLEKWHRVMASGTSEGLVELLSPGCTFWSPVVHTPQQGRDITFLYLAAASQVFATDFHYVREVVQADSAMLEFECVIDDIQINGVDIIRVEAGQIIDFKVMVRPLKAVHKVHEQMMSMLETMKASSTG
ncbi:MAG: nuclear transport factor 2 family protein [Halieaceae bacterium]|jgi:hypothetical protein